MARPLLGNEEIREKYLSTNQERYELLDKYRSRVLTDLEQQILWVLVSDLVYSKSRRHYGRKQSYGRRVEGRTREWYEIPNEYDTKKTQENFETHTARMYMFLKFIKENPHKSIQLLITEWNKRFAWFEMVLDLEKRGIGNIEEKSLTARVNQASIRYLIETKKMIRSYQLHNPEFYLDAKEIVRHWVKQNPDKEYTVQKVKNMLLRVYTYLHAVEVVDADTFTEIGLENI